MMVMSRGLRLPAVIAALAIPAAAAIAGSPAAAVPTRATPASVGGFLRGIDAGPARDAWAVGAGTPGNLTLRWNGTGWAQIPTPSPPNAGSELFGIAVTSDGSAWAVGSFVRGPDGNSMILILRWDGTAWRRVRAPGVPADGGLYAVSATSPRDVWAVGFRGQVSDGSTLILHWNGTAWKRVPSPDPVRHGDDELYGVAAVSATSAWAVGYGATGTSSAAVILHWNGTAWLPVAGPPEVTLNAVAMASASDGWAVGATDAYPYQTVTLHWNGTSWQMVASPDPAAGTVNILYGVAATAAGRAWAVGDAGLKPLILVWDGMAWAREHSPCPAGDCQLFAVTAGTAGGTWAAGENGRYHPLILHWNGSTWTPVRRLS